MRNINRTFNKERLIEHIVKVNIYYQEHKERIGIDVIGGQKWNIILKMLQLICHNPKIDWRTEKVKMMRYSEECRRQQRPKQEKSGQERQKEVE